MNLREKNEKQLIDNRLMQNREEITLFEEAMDELFEDESLDIIPAYIKAFDDNTEDFEVMFGMIHGIEACDNIFGMEDSMSMLFQSVHLFREEAKEWMNIIFRRILNDEKARYVLKNNLPNLSITSRNVIIAILERIKKEDEDEFGIFIDEMVEPPLPKTPEELLIEERIKRGKMLGGHILLDAY
jgi:hypothetical protein